MARPLLLRNQAPGRAGLRSVLKRNAYLTDERRLYRCVGWEGSMVLLEDCVTLDVIAHPASDLSLTGMRLVEPAAAR